MTFTVCCPVVGNKWVLGWVVSQVNWPIMFTVNNIYRHRRYLDNIWTKWPEIDRNFNYTIGLLTTLPAPLGGGCYWRHQASSLIDKLLQPGSKQWRGWTKLQHVLAWSIFMLRSICAHSFMWHTPKCGPKNQIDHAHMTICKWYLLECPELSKHWIKMHEVTLYLFIKLQAWNYCVDYNSK